MKTKKILSTLLRGAAFFVASASSQASNLFQNPGFETGDFTGWISGGGSKTVTSAEAHTGNYSFAGQALDFASQPFTPIPTSSISELSFWGKRDGGLANAVTLSYSDTSSELIIVNKIPIGSSDWTFINLIDYLDDGKLLTGFHIYGTSPGPAYLDDFNLQPGQRPSPVPEASSYLACALLLAPFGAKTFRLLRKRQAV